MFQPAAPTMDASTRASLRSLLTTQPVGALATLHRGEPALSMVPFVLPAGAAHFVIHVSALATHTADMATHARVALLVTDEARIDVPSQARARVSLPCDAEPLVRDSTAYGQARADYLARFPAVAVTFGLADFSLVILRPLSARLVAGFGQAHGLAGDGLKDWLAGRPR